MDSTTKDKNSERVATIAFSIGGDPQEISLFRDEKGDLTWGGESSLAAMFARESRVWLRAYLANPIAEYVERIADLIRGQVVFLADGLSLDGGNEKDVAY